MLGPPLMARQPVPATLQPAPGWMPAARPSWCELLAELAQHQEPEAVWAVLATRLKWLLDFERCDVAVINPDHQTYHLRTVFDARPAVPRSVWRRCPWTRPASGSCSSAAPPSVLLDLARDPLGACARRSLGRGGGLGLRLDRAAARPGADRGRPPSRAACVRGAMRRRTLRLPAGRRPS